MSFSWNSGGCVTCIPPGHSGLSWIEFPVTFSANDTHEKVTWYRTSLLGNNQKGGQPENLSSFKAISLWFKVLETKY